MNEEEIIQTSDNGTRPNDTEPTPQRQRKTKKKLFQYEVDTSPAALAFMKAIRITQERLFPEKVKRADAECAKRKAAEAKRAKMKHA